MSAERRKREVSANAKHKMASNGVNRANAQSVTTIITDQARKVKVAEIIGRAERKAAAVEKGRVETQEIPIIDNPTQTISPGKISRAQTQSQNQRES